MRGSSARPMACRSSCTPIQLGILLRDSWAPDDVIAAGALDGTCSEKTNATTHPPRQLGMPGPATSARAVSHYLGDPRL